MSGNDISIIVRNNTPEDFDLAVRATDFSWDSEWVAWNDFYRARYYPLTGQDSPYIAFIVAMGGSPIALVECNPSAFLLAQFEDAITIRTAANAQADLVAMAEEIALGCIDQITQSMSKNAYIVADQNLGTAHEIPKDTPLSTIGRFCSARKSIALVETEGKVDLSLGETGIHRGLRKSYRSLINWGRKNMCMRYYNADNPDRTLFTTFLTMCKGSEVHGDYSEPVLAFLRELIESGHGELSVGFIGGGAVASTLTLWAGKTTRYNAGVYSGENKDLPLSHWSSTTPSCTASTVATGISAWVACTYTIPTASPRQKAAGRWKP